MLLTLKGAWQRLMTPTSVINPARNLMKMFVDCSEMCLFNQRALKNLDISLQQALAMTFQVTGIWNMKACIILFSGKLSLFDTFPTACAYFAVTVQDMLSIRQSVFNFWKRSVSQSECYTSVTWVASKPCKTCLRYRYHRDRLRFRFFGSCVKRCSQQ